MSDQLPANRTILVVADGLVLADDTITLSSSREAFLEMESAPHSPPVATNTMLSLWQQDLVGLRAERFFSFNVARSRAVAALSY